MVERILALVASSIISFGACTSYGVNFIDKDNRRCLFFGLFEQIAHTARAYTHKHFDEVRTAHGEEWHIGFTSHSLCQEGFTGSRRAYEERAFGDFTSEFGVFLGILQEVYDFLHLLFRTFLSGNVFEEHSVVVFFVELLRFALSHREHATAGTFKEKG